MSMVEKVAFLIFWKTSASHYIERGARRLWVDLPEENLPDEDDPERYWRGKNEYRAIARAALEALRVPSDEMQKAAHFDWRCNTCGGPKEAWDAAITAALGETE